MSGNVLLAENASQPSQGWSKGTVPLFALLAAAASLPASATNFLSSLPADFNLATQHPALSTHLRSVILFEPPNLALGGAPTSDALPFLAAVSSPNAPTAAEFAAAFAPWVAAASGDASRLGAHTVADILRVTGVPCHEPEAAPHAVVGWNLATDADELRRVAEGATKGARWPTGTVCGSHSFGTCAEGVRMVQQWWAEAQGEGRARQQSGARVVQGGTHFAQVLKPREFAAAVVELVNELGGVSQTGWR